MAQILDLLKTAKIFYCLPKKMKCYGEPAVGLNYTLIFLDLSIAGFGPAVIPDPVVPAKIVVLQFLENEECKPD